MISYVSGPLIARHPTYIIVEAGGIGYQIFISLYTYTQLEGLDKVKILTHFIVKEDGHHLYGFTTDEERSLFIALISVNGVGPNTARLILSSLEPPVIRSAILAEDSLLFKKVKGVGPKTAQRIIIDLKDKMAKDGHFETSDTGQMIKNPVRTEAITALIALGFSRPQVELAVQSIIADTKSDLKLEDLIKSALKKLA